VKLAARHRPDLAQATSSESAGLGSGTAGNADLARGHHQELAGGKLVRVICQDGVEAIDLGLKIGAGKPEEQDALMLETLVEDQLAKVAVGNHEDLLLLPRDCRDVLITVETMSEGAGCAEARRGVRRQGP
jgi:hypothetical protein